MEVIKCSFLHLDESFHLTIKVMGKCDIKIKTKNDFMETISNVLYVSNLKSNLSSTG